MDQQPTLSIAHGIGALILVGGFIAVPTALAQSRTHSATDSASVDQRACEAILRFANARKIDAITVKLDDQTPPDDFADQPGVAQEYEAMLPTNEGAFVDLAADDNLVHVMLGTNRAQQNEEQQFFYFDKSWKFMTADSGKFADRTLIKLGKRYFVLMLQGGQLLRVEAFTREDPRHLVCSPTSYVRIRLVQSSNPAVCDAVVRGRIAYSGFDLPGIADEKFRSERQVDLGTGAELNINGQMRLVEQANGGTVPCDSEGIVIFDIKRATVDTPLSDAIAADCNDSVRPFVLGKETFFEVSRRVRVPDFSPDLPRSVTQLNGNRLDTICKFESDTIYRRK